MPQPIPAYIPRYIYRAAYIYSDLYMTRSTYSAAYAYLNTSLPMCATISSHNWRSHAPTNTIDAPTITDVTQA